MRILANIIAAIASILDIIATIMLTIGRIAGAICFIAVIIAIPHCYMAKQNTKKYIADPRIGDLYVTKVAYIDGGGYEGNNKKLVGIMKLIKVDENIVTFVISKKASSRRGYLPLIKEYSDEVVHLQRDFIYDLYTKNIIEEIERNDIIESKSQ